MGDLFVNSQPRSDTDMISGGDATIMDRFVFHRVRNALLSILPESGEEWPDLQPLTLIIQSPDTTHLIFRLYHLTQTLKPPGGLRAKLAWETDIGESLADDVWTICCSQTHFVSSNYRHKLLHYKYIHRIYLTPAFLKKIHPEAAGTCPKCTGEGADLNCGVIRTIGQRCSNTFL